MGKAVYIGRFTPNTGGVTAKNTALYNELAASAEIEKIDLSYAKKGNIGVIFRCVKALLSRKNRLIVGAAVNIRRKITHFLYLFNRRAMENSVLIVMGGQFGKKIANDESYCKWLREYKHIYVETAGMIKDLEALGIMNAALLPNCRKRPERELGIKKSEEPECVFFSLISPQKGADVALEAAKKLESVQFHFYGNISPEYKDKFLSEAESLRNVTYHGVFKGSSDEVYSELGKYDMLLFPTKWANEGVPGVLVETKIAGLAPIVSNMNYNAELVRDNAEGIVLSENTPGALASAITGLIENAALLDKLKEGSRKSAERFYFEAYIDELLNTLGVV